MGCWGETQRILRDCGIKAPADEEFLNDMREHDRTCRKCWWTTAGLKQQLFIALIGVALVIALIVMEIS